MQQPDTKREQNIKRLRSFFNCAEGEFVMKQIDELCFYETDTFHPDPYIHAYRTGRRSVAVEIHNILEPSKKE